MKSKNICKFVPTDISSQIVPTRFILESDAEAMKSSKSKNVNRMILVSRKRGRYNLNGRWHDCSIGDIILFFKNETCGFEGETGFQYLYIDFDGLRSEELFRRFGINESNRTFSGYDGLIPLWMESISRASKENIDLAAESMLLYTFSKLTASAANVDNRINEILQITDEEFSDPQLSISSIAEQLGYNAKYLSYIFKKKQGIRYTEYLRTIRIKYAVSLFEHGIDSIKNVALLSGFTDPLYFSTVFKTQIGVSPKTYIKKLSETQKDE